MKINQKKIWFVVIFVILGLIALQISLSHIVGSKQTFSLFDFLGPTAGMFLGSWVGALGVFIVELINFFIKDAALDTTTFIRFFPMLFAAIYFGTNKKMIVAVPLICIGLFLVHPIGREVPYYPFAFWLIPAVLVFFKKRLFFNALGATLTAHAVGSTAFLYAFNLPASVWESLMSVVPFERLTFAIGITVTYLLLNNLLNYLVQKQRLQILETLVNRKLIFKKSIFRSL